MFTADDTWNTTTHANDYDPAAALRMRPVDVDTTATWSRSATTSVSTTSSTAATRSINSGTAGVDPLLAEFQKTDPATGKPYTQDFGWLNHTWDHAYLDVGCATANYIEAEVQQNTIWAAVGARLDPRHRWSRARPRAPTTRSPTGRRTRPRSCPAATRASPTSLPDNARRGRPAEPRRRGRPLAGGTLATGSYQWARDRPVQRGRLDRTSMSRRRRSRHRSR